MPAYFSDKGPRSRVPKLKEKQGSGRKLPLQRTVSLTTLTVQTWSQPASTVNMEVEEPDPPLISALKDKDWRHVIGSVDMVKKHIKLHNQFEGLAAR